ncbi:hypothetical protein [uncultured Lactobacillus sp.]|uniref:hypothetical protein n=1 Tax=uncultured Lactobacillus sp. TaxID=153152 RepID=UPI0025D5916C|nr:hypothetical protein [uncultured Lactobacillus sp.]
MKNSELRAISKKYADKINEYVADYGLNDADQRDVITIFDDDSRNYPSGQRVDVTFKMNTEGDGLPQEFDMSQFWTRDLDLKDNNLSELIDEYTDAIR